MTLICDGCGEPVGHADEICVEYEEHGIKSFGRRECKEAFEEHHDAEPCVRCTHCGELVPTSEAEEVEYTRNEAIDLVGEIHPSCRSEFFERDDVKKVVGSEPE